MLRRSSSRSPRRSTSRGRRGASRSVSPARSVSRSPGRVVRVQPTVMRAASAQRVADNRLATRVSPRRVVHSSAVTPRASTRNTGEWSAVVELPEQKALDAEKLEMEDLLEGAKRHLRTAASYFGNPGTRSIGRAEIDEELRKAGFVDGIAAATHTQIETARRKAILNLPQDAYFEGFQRLFNLHDKIPRTGGLDWKQFRRALRVSGKITPSVVSDADLKKVFEFVDTDGNGSISAEELNAYVQSGPGEGLQEWRQEKAVEKAKVNAKQSVVAGLAQSHVCALDEREVSALWSRYDGNGTGKMSLAELDKGLKEHPPAGWEGMYHKKSIALAMKIADVDWSGYIRRAEFDLLLRCVVYFRALWDIFDSSDVDGDHRLELWEFKQVRKTSLYAILYSKRDHFTQTGSGQDRGSSLKGLFSCRSPLS